MTALDHVTAYLEPRGLSVAQIRACLHDVTESETIILGGSVAEGLANDDSDIDLMALGGQRQLEGQVLEESGTEISLRMQFAPLKVQLEAVRAGHLEELGAQMAENVRVLRDSSRVVRLHSFPFPDLRILHRLRTGLCLRNEAVADDWRRRLQVDTLPQQLVVLSTAYHFGFREDALGEAATGHYESSLWQMREAVSCAAGAVLASIGESNPYDKWRVRLLQQHRERIGAGLAQRLVAYLATPPSGDCTTIINQAIALSDDAIETALSNAPDSVAVLMALGEAWPGRTHPDLPPETDAP